MSPLVSLKNQFLLAMPTMNDPVFRYAVIYICEHTENGALGVIINRPTAVSLVEVLSDMKINIQDDIVRHIPVLFGGPVHQERGFVIHRPQGQWRSTLQTSEDTFVTTSRDVLEAIAVHQGPQELLITLGCCAWEAGQLDQEIMKTNSWLNTSASPSILFSSPFETRYSEVMASLGINPANLSDETGHA